MKKGICLTGFVFLSVALLGQGKKPSITAYSVEMSTETVVGIPCDEFTTQFQGHIDTVVCFSWDSVEALGVLLKEVKYSENPWSIDTRAVFEYVSSSGQTTEICMDRFKMYVDGKMIRKYPALYNYLYSLIAKKQRWKDWIMQK